MSIKPIESSEPAPAPDLRDERDRVEAWRLKVLYDDLGIPLEDAELLAAGPYDLHYVMDLVTKHACPVDKVVAIVV